MPFTLAHPAAAVPFRRWGLIVSALVMGAVAPDFEYFIRLEPHGRFGHQMPWVLLITFPGALVALWVFHAGMKRGLAALLPLSAQRRLQPYLGNFCFGGGKRFALIAASIAIGIASHLLWDVFTHRDSLVYQHWMWLQSEIDFPALERSMPVYRILQLLSSLVGCLVLVFWTWLWWVRAPEWPTPVRAEWPAGMRAAILTMTVVLSVLCGVMRAAGISGHSLFQRTGIAVVTAISAAIVEALVLGLAWELTHPRGTISARL